MDAPSRGCLTKAVLTISIDGRVYNDISCTLIPVSCADVILGIPFLKIHESVNVHYGGS